MSQSSVEDYSEHLNSEEEESSFGSSTEDLFKKVEAALATDSLSVQHIKSLMAELNLVKVGPHFDESERERASYFLSALENRLFLSANETYAQPVRILRLTKAQTDAVEKVDINGRLYEEDVKIDVDHLLGSGSYGVVYPGEANGVPVAIKELKRDATESEIRSFKREAQILARMRHPYCCEYIGYMEHPFRLVTRRYPTNLEKLVLNQTLTVNDCFRIAYQLTSAIHYIHLIGLIHRDLKLDNVFIDEDGNVRVADFGLVEYAPDTVIDSGKVLGNSMYRSPEQYLGKPFTQKSEIYALGMMLWELFSGTLAFEDIESQKELMERQKAEHMLPITEDYYSTEPDDGLPPKEIFDLAEKCYSYYPENRPELSEVMKKIVDIGVHHVVRKSKTAEDFWKKVCLFTYRNHVLLSTFISNMLEEIKFGKSEDIPDIVSTLRDAVSPFWSMMEITHYWYLCCWFPNFFWSKSSLKEMDAIVHSNWYCYDDKKVDNRLLLAKANAFVIRPSTSDPFYYPYTLCVKKDGRIQHYHIKRVITRKSISFSCDFIKGSFSSIFSLVKHMETDEHIPVAPLNSRKKGALHGVTESVISFK